MKTTKEKIKSEEEWADGYLKDLKETLSKRDKIMFNLGVKETQQKMQKLFEKKIEKCLKLWKTGCPWEIEEAVKQFAQELLASLQNHSSQDTGRLSSEMNDKPSKEAKTSIPADIQGEK